jgi:hypothetical protein
MAETTPTIVEKAQDRLAQAFTKKAKVDGLAQFDPTILLPILLDLAMNLLKNCLASNKSNADAVKAIINKRPIIARTQIRMAMRSSGYLNRPDSNAIVEALMSAGEDTTPAEIHEFVNAVDFTV